MALKRERGKIKCKYQPCGQQGVKAEMVEELSATGKTVKHYHPQCFQVLQEERENAIGMNEVMAEVMKVHNMVVIPQGFYSFLHKFRRGDITLYGSNVKGSLCDSQKISFEAIKDAYADSSMHILQLKKSKIFKTDMGELIYCFKAGVRDRINEMERKRRGRQEASGLVSTMVDSVNRVAPAVPLPPKPTAPKTASKRDISQFVD